MRRVQGVGGGRRDWNEEGITDASQNLLACDWVGINGEEGGREVEVE